MNELDLDFAKKNQCAKIFLNRLKRLVTMAVTQLLTIELLFVIPKYIKGYQSLI